MPENAKHPSLEAGRSRGWEKEIKLKYQPVQLALHWDKGEFKLNGLVNTQGWRAGQACCAGKELGVPAAAHRRGHSPGVVTHSIPGRSQVLPGAILSALAPSTDSCTHRPAGAEGREGNKLIYLHLSMQTGPEIPPKCSWWHNALINFHAVQDGYIKSLWNIHKNYYQKN